MQATFARKAFPCFDEPAMKAVFNITIIHDRGTVALSNGRDIGGFTTLKMDYFKDIYALAQKKIEIHM